MTSRFAMARALVALAMFASLLALEAQAVVAQEPVEKVATPSTRYFGQGAYGAIVGAANSIPATCDISQHGRVALMLAPIFKESSGATTASTAPSPMTLSRFDEWSGTRDGDTNRNANYGLYAFRDPNTIFARAYWHPGIGIWQYDSAGVGSPFTASERMDTGIVGADVARVMFSKYCSAIDRGESGQDARFAAWRDWGYPCRLCESAFSDLSDHRSGAPGGSTSGFQYLKLVSGIDALGGTQSRTCSVDAGDSFPCWYVDPSRAQGADWWAGSPDDGKPGSGMAPLSHPFYVYESGGREYRHWLRADTGYRSDISASRQLGQNARPRTNKANTGLRWSSHSGLCDETTGSGNCGLEPANPELRVKFSVVNGSHYKPFVGDFDGDGLSDVFWYAPGAAPDSVWWSDRNGDFSATSTSVSGSYDPIVGDIDGNGIDDILWYRNGAPSSIWRGGNDREFRTSSVNLPANRQVFLVDTRGDGRHDVIVYGPGAASDHHMTWTNGRLKSRAVTVNGHYQPFVGDFDGNGIDDVFWYAPGPAVDSLWWSSSPSRQLQVTVNGQYRPIVGDFDGDEVDDIVWYGVGATPDHTWFGNSNRRFASRPTPVGGAYRPAVADLDGNGRDDIVWHSPGAGTDYRWSYRSDRSHSSTSVEIGRGMFPLSGVFGSGRDGIFWYGPGKTPDALWYA